jgi:hypothetical protein
MKADASAARLHLYTADQLSQAPAASQLLVALVAAEAIAVVLQTAARACDLQGAMAAAATLRSDLMAAEQLAEQLAMPAVQTAIVAAEMSVIDAEARAERKYYALARSIARIRGDLAALAAIMDLPAAVLADVVVAQQTAAMLQQQLDGATPTPSGAPAGAWTIFVATLQQLVVELYAIDQALLVAPPAPIVYDAAIVTLWIEACAAKLRACAICAPPQTASLQVARIRWELMLADQLADQPTDAALRADVQAVETMAAALREQIESGDVANDALATPIDAMRVQLVACKFVADQLGDAEVATHVLHAIEAADALVAFIVCDASLPQTLVADLEQQLAQAEAALVIPSGSPVSDAAALTQQLLALQHLLDAMAPNVVVCCAPPAVALMGEKQLAAFRADLNAAQLAAAALGDEAIVALLVQAQALALQLRAHEQQAETHIEDYFYALRAALEAAELLVVDPAQSALLTAILALETETATIHLQANAREIQAALAAIAQLLKDVAAAAEMAAEAQNFEAQSQLVYAEVATTQLQAQVRNISAPTAL